MTTGILALVVLSSTFMFPESPRWLALKGRYDEARQVIAIIDNVEPTSEHVDFIVSSIQSTNDLNAERASFSSMFRYGKDKMVYRLLLAAATQLYSTGSGAAVITYYSEELFTTVGLSRDLSKILGASDLTFKLVCCAIPFFLIERAGRRKLLMIAGTGMTVCMVSLGCRSGCYEPWILTSQFSLAICGSQVTEDNLTPAYVAIVFAFLFVAFYPIGFLGVNFLYSQEVISTRYRAPASGISTAVHWLSAFVVACESLPPTRSFGPQTLIRTCAVTTPIGFASIGWKFYLVWAVVALSIIPVVYFFYPETTDLTMEEIEQIFVDSPSVLSTVSLAESRRRAKRQAGVEEMRRIEQFDEDKKQEERYEQALADARRS